MSVEDSQCAAFVTEFGSHRINVALSAVQGVVTFLSVVGSALLILCYVILKPLRTKSRLLIAHLAAANFLQAFPNLLPVFMDFRTKFKFGTVPNNLINHTIVINSSDITVGLTCSGEHLFDHTTHNYCGLCVYLQFSVLLVFLPPYFGLSVCAFIILF